MTLADQLASAKGGSNQGFACSVGTLLRTLEGEQLAELRRFLDDPSVAHAALERAIKAEGHFVGVGSIGKHRRHDCRCFL